VDLPQRERIRDDLKGVVKGELLFDDLACALYSTDASIFEIQPLGVVTPRDEADVQALVHYAGEHKVPLIARGAGTGVAGEALGQGLIVDLSRHFRAILDVGADTVRVQPGVVQRELGRRLAEVGRRFAPDPASLECTVGGMLATNASGARAGRHGYTRDHVRSLRVVLDNGDAVELGRQSRWPAAEASQGRLDDIAASVATLLDGNAELIRTCRPATPYNRCGYLLHDVLASDQVDLARLLVGSEGTLGLITEATLRTIPLPEGRAVVLLSFNSLDTALRAASLVVPTGPAACDLLDRRVLRLATGTEAPASILKTQLLPPATEAILLVEYEAGTPSEARRLAVELADRLQRLERLTLLARVASEPDEIERFWQVREAVLPSLYNLRGAQQPLPFLEDVGVPLEALPGYLHRIQEILQRHEIIASFLVHAATGQVHMRPFLDLRQHEEMMRMWALTEEVYTLVLEVGGTISTQHGTGLARTPWVSRQVGPLYSVFCDLKAIFDPRHLFNPGKIVGPAPGRQVWPLRRWEDDKVTRWQGDKVKGTDTPSPSHPVTLSPCHLVTLSSAELASQSWSCNGCGRCRTEAPTQRMCPIFRVTHGEAATPRAKANLMRFLLQQDAEVKQLSSPGVREIADLCVNCKMCALECPAHIQVPRLMLEAKAAHMAQHGLDRPDWVLARTETFAQLGSALAPLTNAVLDNRVVRWLLEKLCGISRLRGLPAFAARNFFRRARRRGWMRKPRSQRPRVAYFVDIFANYNDPLIAEAVVAVLHHHGIEVYVPPGQLGCGMAPLAHGDVETARETAESNLRILSELAREGYPILCSEPTAALMLRQDALDLLDDPDARLVADRTVEFTAFLWDLHQRGQLRNDFQRLDFSVGHHVPCHLKALGGLARGPALLSLIPGLRVHTIDVSCSGMAGTFGLNQANYQASLEAGRPMLEELSRPGVLFGSTECSTCRMQMEDGARKRTLHPAQYLALAYGLLPEVLQQLRRPIHPRVL
jgi:FAD/FMN-containing dehydrogenase/Fe-S oxidoreductase